MLMEELEELRTMSRLANGTVVLFAMTSDDYCVKLTPVEHEYFYWRVSPIRFYDPHNNFGKMPIDDFFFTNSQIGELIMWAVPTEAIFWQRYKDERQSIQ